MFLTSSNQKDLFSKMTPQLGREWTLVLENKREIPLSDQAEEAGQEKGTVNPHPGLLFTAQTLKPSLLAWPSRSVTIGLLQNKPASSPVWQPLSQQGHSRRLDFLGSWELAIGHQPSKAFPPAGPFSWHFNNTASHWVPLLWEGHSFQHLSNPPQS